MRDISDNKYLLSQNINDDDCSFDNFLFDRNVLPKRVDALSFLSAVRELLSMLGFKVQFGGYKYLSRLVKHYLVLHDYTEEIALERISELYQTDADSVRANIASVIGMNKEFVPRAEKLLSIELDKTAQPSPTDATEIIAALFKIYYNLETDEYDMSDEIHTSINWEKVFSHGKQKRKDTDSRR